MIIKKFGHITIGVSAQERVSLFYSKIGYLFTEEKCLDEGCPHIYMVKEI